MLLNFYNVDSNYITSKICRNCWQIDIIKSEMTSYTGLIDMDLLIKNGSSYITMEDNKYLDNYNLNKNNSIIVVPKVHELQWLALRKYSRRRIL